jgi:predicted acylesterase/phospholipase RssA
MKRRISIAFQGGGAKVIALLAAADAISELIRDDSIEVVTVSGSSAGSIAALLLSAGADFSKVRYALQQSAEEISRNFPAINSVSMTLKAFDYLIRGKPIYSPRLFNSMIAKVLGLCGIDVLKDISDVQKIPLFITVSDIYQGKTVIHDRGNIRDALRKSCAIPFVFSSHRADDQGQFVDGGVFDNLPTDVLIKNSPLDVPVFAIGFSPDAAEPAANSFRYILSLMFSVVSYKVSGSRESIGQEFVYELKTTLGTLDFNKMVSIGINEEYDALKKQTRDFFDAWMSGARGGVEFETVGRRAAVRLREMERVIIENIDSLFKGTGGTHEYIKMTVDANCLLNRRTADEIKTEQLLRLPDNGVIPGMVIPTMGGDGTHARTDCIVKLDGPLGPDIEFRQFVINDEIVVDDIAIKRNSVVIMFATALGQLSGRNLYVLTKEQRFGFMLPLLQKGSDYLTLTARVWDASELYVQLNVPDAFGRVNSDWSIRESLNLPQRITVSPGELRSGWSGHAAKLTAVRKSGHLKGLFSCAGEHNAGPRINFQQGT